MNLGTYDINIDFSKLFVHNNTSIYFKEGDLNTAKVRSRLTMKNKPINISGCNVTIRIEPSEGNTITDNATVIDPINGIIEIDLKSNALLEGTHLFEVWIIKDDSVKKSGKIGYRVLDSIDDSGAIEGTNEYPILISLISDTNKAIQDAKEVLNIAKDMETNVNEAIDNAYISANNADIATSNANSKIEEVETAKTEMIKQVDNSIANMKIETNTAINSMTSKTDEKITDVNRALAAGTKDLEVKEARRDMDGVEHATLKVRLESDLKKGKVIEETKEGTYLSFNDTIGGLVSYLEVLGNTVQDASNLANIRSSCIPNGDGTFKMSILSVGENLFNGKVEVGGINNANGLNANVADYVRSVDFVPVNKNTSYTCKNHGYDRRIYSVYFYRSDKTYISYKDLASVGEPFITPNDCKFIRFIVWETNPNLLNYSKIKLQEGTVATPYTPYQETRCNIKLPCQLEKWDRLYFDKEENAWCVEKFTLRYAPRKQHYTIASLENVYRCFPSSPTLESAEYKNDYGKATTICKGLPFILDNYFARDEEHYYIDPNAKREYLFFNKDKFDGTSEGLNRYFESIDFYMLIKLASPEKIVLPQSEQIKLNSFANKTHIYTISGDVDATVKATVSKSLASTVQAHTDEINILNDKIADIQGLKESQDFAYETDRGYLVCKDTQNGVVKDLKISGKSLVNDGGIVNKEFTQFSVILNSKKMLTPNKEYTLIIENKTNTDLIVYTAEESIVPTQNINIKANSTTVKKIVSQSTVNSLRLLKSNTPNSNLFNLNVLLLEGDHTQNPPSYFEGIASVGNGNEIEVLSRKEDGNLFDGELLDGLYNTSTGVFTPNSDVKCNKNKIAIFDNRKIKLSQPLTGGSYRVFFYNSKGDYLESQLITSPYTFAPNVNARYINFQIAKTHYKEGIALNYDGFNSFEYRQDRKPILFKDIDNTWKPVTELRGINENKCDTIEEHSDNRHYKHERILKTVLNGTEQWNLISTATSDTIRCYILGNGKYIPNDNKNILADKISKYDTASLTDNCIGIDSNGNIVVGIKKSELTTQDVDGVKAYLVKNNITLLTVMPKEKVYEVNPLDLESYSNETMILFGSGVISPPASFKITSSLPNFVKELSKQVRQLQDQVYKTNVANFTVALNTLDTKLRLDRLESPQQ